MRLRLRVTIAALLLAVTAGVASAHITPPVVLASDRDALVSLLSGAQKFFVREVRLSAEQKQAVQRQSGWTPDEDFYRFYLGRDAEGRLVAATIFLTEYTVHGPIRVAVSLDASGKVKGVMVTELTEETYGWVKPLIDGKLIGAYIGQDASGKFVMSGDTDRRLQPMEQFYGQIIGGLVKRAALLYDVGIGREGRAA
jgi:Na+-translocating ferredoxin:NAD+ oxidoreductase RnfG subunit